MTKARKILVADDDRITREIIGAILTKAGHDVVFAEDGKSALELASREMPDLVFIDGLMPKKCTVSLHAKPSKSSRTRRR